MEKTKRVGSKQSQKNATLRIKKVLKRKEADTRQAKYDALSLEEKLKNATGKKEIAKLKAKIESQKAEKVAKSTLVETSVKAVKSTKTVSKKPVAKTATNKTKTPVAKTAKTAKTATA